MSNYNLYHYCRRNDTQKAVNILNKSKEIDILYKGGIFLQFAISKGNVEICESLLKYFNEIQFSLKNKDYEDSTEELTEILENAIDSVDISSEMKQTLSPYVSFNNSIDDRLNDSIFEEENLVIENESSTRIMSIKKSHSTGDLSNGTNIFSSDSSSNHSSGKKTSIIHDMFLHDKNHDFQTDKIEDTHIVGETQSNDAF